MSELRINNITDRAGSSGPIIAGVSTVTSTSHMVMPSGPTEMRGGRGTAITLGGYTDPAASNIIDKMTIATTGDAVDFGDISAARYEGAAVGSATRGIVSGGAPSTFTIDYVIFSSGGGSNDFGKLQLGRSSWSAGANDSVRGFIMGGSASPTPATPRLASIEFVIMATTGDASEFGDLTLARTYMSGAGCQSTTRGLFAGGHPMNTNLIDFVLFSTGGTATKFGDLTLARSGISAGSNATRGIFAGGSDDAQSPSAGVNTIDYITMATEGNATDFGDATITSFRWMGAGMYSATRGVHCGGYPAINVIQFITVATTGNAIDFGDLRQSVSNSANSSDSHGGLG